MLLHSYANVRLFDASELRARMPLEIDELVDAVRKAARATVESLRKRWLRECAQLVLEARDAIESLMPPRPEPDESGMATGTRNILFLVFVIFHKS